MLYTFSQADYPQAELDSYFAGITAQDAVLLWQDGVLLALKYPDLFSHCQADCYALDLDLNARGLVPLLSSKVKVRSISMAFLVGLSEQYAPQFAL